MTGGTPHRTTGMGAGDLSEQALSRLARPVGPLLRPPPQRDAAAVAAWRESVHTAWLAGDPPPEELGHRGALIGGVRCLRAGPTEPEAGSTASGAGPTASVVAEPDRHRHPDPPVLLYLHGGGFALGSPEVAVPITARLAAGFDLVSVDYRLAPEHPFPAALQDCLTVHRAVRSSTPGVPVALVGDSAGANLALCLALTCRDLGEPGPAALVLLSPHLDHAPTGGRSRPARSPGDDVDEAAAAWLTQAYCGERSPDDPAVSPLRADLAGLPPTLVQVASTEPLLAHSVRFARLARLVGVDVTLDVWDGLWHTWHYHRDLPEADHALAEVRAYLQRHVAGGGADGAGGCGDA